MKNVMVDYQYNGEETLWQQLITEFINAVESDQDLDGQFHYQVFSMPEGRKVHIGRWPNDSILKALQSKEYFRTFAKGIQSIAGDSLKSHFGTEVFSTND